MPIPSIRNFVRRLVGDRRGNVAVLAALALPVLIGSLGVGAEVASWYGGKRGLQNAADSAAIAAATNGTSDGYDDEARAVAAQYGFKNGVDGVTVTALNNQACPDGGSNKCYAVTVSKTQPILLAQIVGFKGDTTVNGVPSKVIAARAVAIQGMGPREYCILALAGSGKQQGLRTNGAPFANLSGCNVMSNTDAVCNGHDLNADVGDAHGANNGCGNVKNSGVPTVADPYAALASNIPSNPCSSYPVAPKKKKDPPLPDPANTMHGLTPSLLIQKCGDVELTGPTFINSNGNTTLVIYNGTLDLKGYTLQTQPGSSLTIIFAGSDQSRAHTPIGSGTLDINAPTTGPWKGIALYQAPNLTSSTAVDISEAGNQPNWKITGLGYFPHSSLTFSGAVSKSSNGAKCFGMVADNLTINGTGSILDNGECDQAGLDLPKGVAPARGELVS